MKWVNLLAGVALATGGLGSAASADVLYSNGPINGTINANGIEASSAIGDSFTLTSAATVTGVNFGVWAARGVTMSSVDWGITDTFGVVPDNGAAVVSSGTVSGTTPGNFDLRTDSFSTGAGISLAAGTYYLWLQNASDPDSDNFYWDVNNGPSSAYSGFGTIFSGSEAGKAGPGSNSNAFEILGTTGVTDVPEPSTWAMLILGVLGLGAARFRPRSSPSAW